MTTRSEGLLASRNGDEAGAFGVRLPGALARESRGVSRLQFDSIEISIAKVRADGMVEEAAAVSSRNELERTTRERQVQSDLERVAAEVAAAHVAGRLDARRELEDDMETRVAVERATVMQTCERFGREREGYFAAVEGEVVKLALAIAARVLHREVKLDPMLLQAVVKVALGKVMEETSVVLRVPVRDEQAWRALMEGEEAVTVTVTGDSRLGAGECVLETNIGRVELGVEAQLEEIEKGFFDLLQQRPA